MSWERGKTKEQHRTKSTAVSCIIGLGFLGIWDSSLLRSIILSLALLGIVIACVDYISNLGVDVHLLVGHLGKKRRD